MLELPALERMKHRVVVQEQHWTILHFLKRRFGTVPKDLQDEIHLVEDVDHLRKLLDEAVYGTDLEAFRRSLRS